MKDNRQEFNVEAMEEVSGGGVPMGIIGVRLPSKQDKLDYIDSLGISESSGSSDSPSTPSQDTSNTNYNQNNSNNNGIQLNTQNGDSVNNGGGGIVLNQ